MELANLTGSSLGSYLVHERIGEGGAGVVYRAMRQPMQMPVALRVLDPVLASRASFIEHLDRDARTISLLRHPGILPVYDFGTRDGLTYLAMKLVAGGTLKQMLDQGTIDIGQAWRILSSVANALHQAHEAGVVHMDVKPTNILIESDGAALVADFGLTRSSYGFVLGTPGYMAPEQATGTDIDRRADVYALGVIVFEMLTGTRPYSGATTELIKATVGAPVPSACERNPELPPELDLVLFRALAKNPGERQPTTLELMRELGRVPIGNHRKTAAPQVEIAAEAYKGTFAPPAVAAPAEAPAAAPEAAAERAEQDFRETSARLMAIFETALTAAIVIDEGSFITGWNEKAESTFGWTRDEIVGRSLSSTLVPGQYREAHERGFRKYMNTGEGPVLGTVIEISALHRDGHEFPIELSISPAARSGKQAMFVGFARDITADRRSEQIRTAQAVISEALPGSKTLEGAGPRILEAIAGGMGWDVAALWTPSKGGDELRCHVYWHAPDLEDGELEKVCLAVSLGRDAELPGQVWASGDARWVEDVLREAESSRALAALRTGMHSAVGLPIVSAGETIGVVELFSAQSRKPDEDLTNRLELICRQVGKHYRAQEPKQG